MLVIGYAIGTAGGRDAGWLFEITRTNLIVKMAFKLGFEAALGISFVVVVVVNIKLFQKCKVYF